MTEDQKRLTEAEPFSEEEYLKKLAIALLKSYNSVPFSKQQILSEFLPQEEKSDKKKTYSQNWSLYYQSCRSEKIGFYKILKSVIDDMDIPIIYSGNGRPPADMKDIIKCLCIKVYHNYSAWRLESELKIAFAMGIIDNVYRRSALLKYMGMPEITQYLHQLYKKMAEPLAQVEVDFAIDATGMGTFDRDRWVNVRLEQQKHKDYRKLHIVSGTKSNIVCSALITDGRKHESPTFEGLLSDARKIFNIQRISADSAYLSRKNCKVAEENGAMPFIMPKKNIKPTREINAWGRMIRMFNEFRVVFAHHYHKRSNVESTFSAIKGKFGHYVRSHTSQAQENEVLCKVICHNACVLHKAILEFDLNPIFYSSTEEGMAMQVKGR